MRRDLHVVEKFCYLGEQELGKTQAPQLEAVIRLLLKIENLGMESKLL
jgi:hypothetical protein